MSNKELLEKLKSMGADVDDALLRLRQDENLYVKYLKKLPDNTNILELRRAVEAGDSERAAMEIHALKGVLLNLGIVPLVKVCMAMMDDFKAGNDKAAFAQLDAVESCFKKWSDVLSQYRT